MSLTYQGVEDACMPRERVRLFVSANCYLSQFALLDKVSGKKYCLDNIDVLKGEVVYVYTLLGKNISFTPQGYVKTYELYLNLKNNLWCNSNEPDVVNCDD